MGPRPLLPATIRPPTTTHIRFQHDSPTTAPTHFVPVPTLPTAASLGLLILSSLPMFRGPRWIKSAFARLVRATKRVPAWQWTELADTGVILGSVPRTDDQLKALRVDAGVRAVVTLNQRWEPQVSGGVGAACSRNGLGHLFLPTPDYSVPRQADIERAVAFISEHVQQGGKVYVHCNAGRGRSAVCALAYLMQTGGLSARGAYDLVAAQRRITPLPTRMWGFPRPQWLALLRFEASLERGGGMVMK